MPRASGMLVIPARRCRMRTPNSEILNPARCKSKITSGSG